MTNTPSAPPRTMAAVYSRALDERERLVGRELAVEYGVSHSTIKTILAGKTYVPRR